MKQVFWCFLLVSIVIESLRGAKLRFHERAKKGVFSSSFSYFKENSLPKGSPLRPLEFNKLSDGQSLSFTRPKKSVFYLAAQERALQAKLSAKSNGPHLREITVPQGSIFLYYPIMYLYSPNGEIEKSIVALTEYKSSEAGSKAQERQGINFDFTVEKGKVVLYTFQISTEKKFEAHDFDFSFLSNSEESDLDMDLDLALMESLDAKEAEATELERSIAELSMLGEDEEELDRQIKEEIEAQKQGKSSPSEQPNRFGEKNFGSNPDEREKNEGQFSENVPLGNSQIEKEEFFEDPVFENVTKKDGPKTMKVTFDRVENVNFSCGSAERVPVDPFVLSKHGRAFYHCEQTSKLVIEMDRIGRSLSIKLLKSVPKSKSGAKLVI